MEFEYIDDGDIIVKEVKDCETYLIEYISTSRKNKHCILEVGYYFNFDDNGEIIKVSSKGDACRDKEDNFLLSLARDGKSNYLITGDKEQLVIESFSKNKIINVVIKINNGWF